MITTYIKDQGEIFSREILNIIVKSCCRAVSVKLIRPQYSGKINKQSKTSTVQK